MTMKQNKRISSSICRELGRTQSKVLFLLKTTLKFRNRFFNSELRQEWITFLGKREVKELSRSR